MTGSSPPRAGIFDTDDLSDFVPSAPASKPKAEEVRAVAEETAFHSRESALPPADPQPRRLPRRYRTGRNVQLNLKVRQEAADAFYALADQLDLVLGEAFERAVDALRRETIG